jgi:hypothetical protein
VNAPAPQTAVPHCRYCGGVCGLRGYCSRDRCLARARAESPKVTKPRRERCSFCPRLRLFRHFAKTCGSPACRAAYRLAVAAGRDAERFRKRARAHLLELVLAYQAEQAGIGIRAEVWRPADRCWIADLGGQRVALEPVGANWCVWVDGRVRRTAPNLGRARLVALKLSGAMGQAA